MIPNYKHDVEAAAVKYADAWKHAHVEGDPRRLEFIKLLARDLHVKDPKVNCNGKRGNPNDLSADALNILCHKDDSAGRTPDGRPCVVVDVIGGAGGSNPQPAWIVYNTLVEGSGAAVDPNKIPAPAPAPAATFPYPDEGTAVLDFEQRVEKAYKAAKRKFPDEHDADAFRHFTRYGYSCHEMPEPEAANKHIKELREELGAPPETP